MKIKPEFVSQEQWDIIQKYAIEFENEEYFIVAIGQHETKWGLLGAGKIGYILGYGYFHNSPYLEKTKGFENQVRFATDFIHRFFKPPVTLESVTNFAVNHWKSSKPESWASSVYKLFSSLISKYVNTSNNEIPVNYENRFRDIEDEISYINNNLNSQLESLKTFLVNITVEINNYLKKLKGVNNGN